MQEKHLFFCTDNNTKKFLKYVVDCGYIKMLFTLRLVNNHEIRLIPTTDTSVTIPICSPMHYADKKTFAVIESKIP